MGVQASKLLDGKVIHMATSPDDPPPQEPDATTCIQPQKGALGFQFFSAFVAA
jgi:hypothetical protein